MRTSAPTSLVVLSARAGPSRLHFSEQLFLAPKISEGADVGQGKVEAELVFVADRSQGEAAIFDTQAATVPVIGGLRRGVLQHAEVRIESQVGGSAESAFVGLSVAQQDAELIEDLLSGCCRSTAGRQQICVPAADGVPAEAVVHKRSA